MTVSLEHFDFPHRFDALVAARDAVDGGAAAAAAEATWNRANAVEAAECAAYVDGLAEALAIARDREAQVADVLRRKARDFTHLRCRCGADHAKTRVDPATLGLRRTARTLEHWGRRRRVFAPGAGFALRVDESWLGSGVRVFWFSPEDEYLYDVTDWARCHFELRDPPAELIFTMGKPMPAKASNRLWQNRREADAPPAADDGEWATADAPPRRKKGKKGKRRK